MNAKAECPDAGKVVAEPQTNGPTSTRPVLHLSREPWRKTNADFIATMGLLTVTARADVTVLPVTGLSQVYMKSGLHEEARARACCGLRAVESGSYSANADLSDKGGASGGGASGDGGGGASGGGGDGGGLEGADGDLSVLAVCHHVPCTP